MKINWATSPLNALRIVLALATSAVAYQTTRAADHGDAPNVSGDQGADLADLYFFRHPTVATDAVIIATVRGFIVPGEAENFAVFDPKVRFRFEIESTGDAKADRFIDVVFGPRENTSTGQKATLTFTGFGLRGKNAIFTKAADGVTDLRATDPTLDTSVVSPPQNGAPTQIVHDLTVNSNAVKFFAGEVDDPFFFDIPAFSRVIAKLTDDNDQTAADLSNFDRGRDTFAGYNIMAIAIQVPISMLGTPPAAGDYTNKIGVSCLAQRRVQILKKTGEVKSVGAYLNADRLGNPGVNVALIPFARKNEYNAATTLDDSKLRFLGDADHVDDGKKDLEVNKQKDLRGIADVLAADNLGTPEANVTLLAKLAVLAGDFLRLDVTQANTGTGGGDNSEAAFPNGRRLRDDVIDTLLQVLTGIGGASDNVDASDVTPQDVFPFLGYAQQPLPRVPADPNLPDTNVDDKTRN